MPVVATRAPRALHSRGTARGHKASRLVPHTAVVRAQQLAWVCETTSVERRHPSTHRMNCVRMYTKLGITRHEPCLHQGAFFKGGCSKWLVTNPVSDRKRACRLIASPNSERSSNSKNCAKVILHTPTRSCTCLELCGSLCSHPRLTHEGLESLGRQTGWDLARLLPAMSASCDSGRGTHILSHTYTQYCSGWMPPCRVTADA